jgi:predicted outer membrane protein
MSGLSFIRTAPLVALLLAAGCAREEQPRGAPPPSFRPARPGPSRAAVTPAQYVSQASSIDLFLIGASELAMRKSSRPRTREFAVTEITAHKGTSAQLSLEARRLNLLPSATLSARHQAMLNELERSADFDALYRRDELIVHQEAEALHSRYASTGSSPTLRPVAQLIAPIIERHQRMLKYL